MINLNEGIDLIDATLCITHCLLPRLDTKYEQNLYSSNFFLHSEIVSKIDTFNRKISTWYFQLESVSNDLKRFHGKAISPRFWNVEFELLE